MRQMIARITWWRAISLLLSFALVASGCTDSGLDVLSQDGLTLVNATADSVGFQAIEVETANRASIKEGPFPATALGSHVLAPSTSINVPA